AFWLPNPSATSAFSAVLPGFGHRKYSFYHCNHISSYQISVPWAHQNMLKISIFLDFSIFCRYDCVKDQQFQNITCDREVFYVTRNCSGNFDHHSDRLLYSKVFKRFHLSAEGSQRDFLVSL